jgi:hypothetical protein
MRATRRNFVVEYKNRSRQTKSDKPVSIWGDTDLKAVARQVVEQSAHLSTKAAEEPIVDQAVAKGPEFENDRRSETIAPAAQSQINDREIAQPATEAPPTMTIAEDLSEDVVPLSPAVASPIIELAEEKPARRRYVRRVKPAAVENDGISHVSRADLEALQDENSRLKSELRKRLSADNELLRAMLSRFS